MRLLKFFEFIIESRRQVELPVVFSNDFKDKMDNLGSMIAEEFKRIYNKTFPYTSQYTLISLGDSDDTIKYVDSSKVEDYLKRNHPQINPIDYLNWIVNNKKEDSDLNKLPKTEIKIGRFINKFFPDTFTDKSIENFVNEWKSKFDEYKFEIWSGTDIKKAYQSNNYHFSENSSNPLMNSCMNDELHLVDFYSYCPTCKALVLLDEENHILGRALVWKDSKDRIIMDRVYYVYDKDYYKFVRYANENGWYYKKRNISGGSSFLKNGKEISLSSSVRIPDCFKFIDDGFPYMDTFYFAQGEWAMNYQPEDGTYLKLQDTDGGYERFSNLYDIHGQEIIDESDYVFSKEQDGYIYCENAIRVKYSGGQGYESYSYDDWIEESYLEKEKHDFIKIDQKWYKEKHCVWSNTEDKWIWRPDSIWNGKDWISWENFNPVVK